MVLATSATLCVACGSRHVTGLSAVTFNDDVAPLIWQHCATCHRPAQLAPFSLLTYTDVRSHASEIVKATKSRVMPPWLPDSDFGEFENDRRLRSEEIGLIERWVKQGALEGDVTHRRAPPTWVDGWQLGHPDLVVELPEPYILKPGKTDVFRNFVIPIPLTSARYVRGIEVRPGNRHIVHHATIGIDRTRASRLLDEADPEPGYEGMFSEGAHSPENHALGWTPGMVPMLEPPDMAWRLESGSDLIVQVHMMRTHLKEPERVQPSVGFYFTDTPPTRFPIDFKLGSKSIDIPAGKSAYVAEDVFVLPVDVDVLSVYPHAHYLGKEMNVFAVRPDGTTRRLLRIKDWNFNWQDLYRYSRAVVLPRGTRLTMRYTYDNSAANARNPHRPPTRVVYGPQSTDEMGDLWLRLLPHSAADAVTLAQAFVQNERRKDIAVAEQGVRTHPDDAGWHDLLGTRYLSAGRVGDAVVQLEGAIRLKSGDAEAHNNLAQALQRLGKPADAIAQYREAARLAPKNDQIHLNLAGALQDRGDLEGAVQHYRTAVALNPNVAESHNNFGVALGSIGKIDDAVVQFQEALRIRPDYPEATNNLAAARKLLQAGGR